MPLYHRIGPLTNDLYDRGATNAHWRASHETLTANPSKRHRTDTLDTYEFSRQRQISGVASPPDLSYSHSRDYSRSPSVSPEHSCTHTPRYLLPTTAEHKLDEKSLSQHLRLLRADIDDQYDTELQQLSGPLGACDFPTEQEVLEILAAKKRAAVATSSSFQSAASSLPDTELLQHDELESEAGSYSSSEDESFHTPDPFMEVEQLPLEEFMHQVALRLWEWVAEDPSRFELQTSSSSEDELDQLESGEYTAAEQKAATCRVA